MRRLKVPLTAILLVIVLVDLVVGYHLWDSGWPKRVTSNADEAGVVHFHAAPIPFTAVDWLILVLVVGVHAGLLALVWRAWRARPVRV